MLLKCMIKNFIETNYLEIELKYVIMNFIEIKYYKWYLNC